MLILSPSSLQTISFVLDQVREMSWLANFANSLRVDDDDHSNGEGYSPKREGEQRNLSQREDNEKISESSEDPGGRGVKEDLNELTKTLTRQLWGVASFLAPPPSSSEPSSHTSPSPPPPPPPLPPAPVTRSISDWNRWDATDQSVSSEKSDPEIPDSGKIAGIRNDFAEIGGRFRTGISKLSNHKAVSEFSKIASTFLPFGSEEELAETLMGGAVGVTKEVLAFARNIAMHPETWLDFPLADDEDSDDFDMSDAQQEHALAVERLAPRLAALRIELCPGYMSEGCFWKIYFVLLHPRLNKHDADLLSTPQIVEARAMLTQDLQNRTKTQELSRKEEEQHYYSPSTIPPETTPLKTFACDMSPTTTTTTEPDKHPITSSETQVIDKSIVEEEKPKDITVTSSSKFIHPEEEEDGDDWLEDDENSGIIATYSGTHGNEEDVSFSDLEDDDDKSIPVRTPTSSKSKKESQDQSNDHEWLNVDEVDIE